MATRDEDARARLLGLIGDLTSDPEDPLGEVVAARILQEQLPAALQEVVNRARELDVSWQDLATALGLKTASSAHWHYGKGRPAEDTPPATKKDRLEALRSRAAGTRSPHTPAPELPGLTRQKAAEKLGCDPKTVVRRAANLEGVRAEDFTSSSGKTIRRYFLL